ncbi:alcohol dehydrogenase [Anaeromyxobacter diazotrophicus]|uniref:alcohol dehydrogenase n=1 Tax=Anaeromyxobacter diazotrophicus TaxID=2590199 RepID=UPI001591710F|nr:alcohol dehydrogenase [Anaeromyxobacter diazotrophicus]
MARMRAVQVAKAGGALELVEREVPAPGPGQVRLRVEACGVCHSDAMVKGGAFPGLTLPRVPGHEIAGVVDAVGPQVTAWKPGDRAGVGWHGGHCFQCAACRHGWFINCERARITGISFDGGYAEYAVAPQEALARMPDELGAVEAAPLLCAGITTFNALRNSGARAGDTVAVQGIGGLGHLALQYAARMGFRTVALSHGADKEALARQLGAHAYVDTQRTSAAEGLARLGGADLVLATAPHAEAIAATVAGLKPRGKLLVVAAPFEPLQVSAFALLSGKTVAGWPSGSAIDSEETLAFSALTGVRPRVERFPLEQAEEALAKMLQNRVRFRAVLTP